jgi:type IV pilus assembly protein PilB
MNETRLRLGETLVEAAVITAEALKRALELQKERQLRLGTILLQEGFVTESQLVQALSLKLSIPWVSLWRVEVPDEVLDLVPVNVAEEFFLMPIYVRTTKGGERALYVAMNDPTDDNALRFVKASAGMPVKPMIAGPSDISAAIRFYYYGEEDVAPSIPPPSAPVAPPTGQAPGETAAAAPPPPPPSKGRTSRPPPPRPSAPEPGSQEEEIEEIDDTELEAEPVEEQAGSPEEAAPVPDGLADGKAGDGPAPVSEPKGEGTRAAPPADGRVFADKTSAQREAERRLFGVGGARPTKGFALTLLDGTQISFGPGMAKRKSSSRLDSGASLTREDLLAGLKAAARGQALDDFLPSDRWEAYTAALLGVLMRKHLVFFEELMKELEEITGTQKN